MLNNGLVDKLIPIKKDNKIIGKRLIRKIKWGGRELYPWLSESPISVYHGTKFVSIEHIMNRGLKNTGEPLKGHIGIGRTFDNIKDWSNAIFVTPSIFYASKYAEIFYSDGEEWFIIVEARLSKESPWYRKVSFHKSTFFNYIYKNNEPTEVEIRIEVDPASSESLPNEVTNCICTTSLLFANKSYLEKLQNYNEGDIFINDIIKFAEFE